MVPVTRRVHHIRHANARTNMPVRIRTTVGAGALSIQKLARIPATPATRVNATETTSIAPERRVNRKAMAPAGRQGLVVLAAHPAWNKTGRPPANALSFCFSPELASQAPGARHIEVVTPASTSFFCTA